MRVTLLAHPVPKHRRRYLVKGNGHRCGKAAQVLTRRVTVHFAARRQRSTASLPQPGPCLAVTHETPVRAARRSLPVGRGVPAIVRSICRTSRHFAAHPANFDELRLLAPGFRTAQVDFDRPETRPYGVKPRSNCQTFAARNFHDVREWLRPPGWAVTVPPCRRG